ncbi:phosphatidate cytidylyltransferase [Candidatus Pelagibacter sp.]|nr:phosphatidate cytidylyltransferase [Candidatus Pelagibacter sp.]
MIVNNLSKRILSSVLLLPLALFFIIKGSFFFNFFICVCFLFTSYEWYMMTKKKNYHIIGYLFLIFSFFCAYLLRNLDSDEGGLLFLLVIVVCVSSDIGGFVFGKIFKGPKLTKVSPNKTYSGMVGGYLLSIIGINFYFYYADKYLNKNAEFNIEAFIMVILISSISQFGDIIISYFKRLSKIKDTGKIIPGHGGILDRIDGMIFAIPFTYLILISGIFE